ncbi:MAG: SGNH/GDSL hydrolase family protein [Phyllobacterium sp.]
MANDTPPAIVEKKPDAKSVLVVGDFMAGGLADGLDSAFSENPGVRIVDRTNGSSGFVRDDHFDWPAQIGDILTSEKPAVIVMMIGSNDRQQIRIGNEREAPRSDAWNKEYLKRINAFTAKVKESGIPLVWVGQPSFKFSGMSTDLLAFNEIYRNATESVGGSFVDIWDGFVDEKGEFITSGFDINGQTVRLRSNDGIRLSTAGKRKVAFYTEKPLQQILGEGTAPNVAAIKPGNMQTPTLDPLGALIKLDRVAPIGFTDPEMDGGKNLLGAGPRNVVPSAKMPQDLLVIDGKPPASQPGRINDFSWPKKSQAAATAAGPRAQTGTAQ